MVNGSLVMISILATFAAAMLTTRNPSVSLIVVIIDAIAFYVLLELAFTFGLV